MPGPLPPSRSRRIAKWTGLVVCLLIVGLWAVSLMWWFSHETPRRRMSFLSDGRIVSVQTISGPAYPQQGIRVLRHKGPRRYGIYSLDFSLRRPWGKWSVQAPLWLPFIIAAIPTAILWRRDRHTVKPGCCRVCGYDLRASKKTCPECGTAINERR